MKNKLTIARLLLANASIGFLICVPVLANIINTWGIFDLISVIISIIILVKGKNDVTIKKTSSMWLLLAAVINCVGIFYHVESITSVPTGDLDTLADSFSIILFGVISWIFRIMGTIYAFLEYRGLLQTRQSNSQYT